MKQLSAISDKGYDEDCIDNSRCFTHHCIIGWNWPLHLKLKWKIETLPTYRSSWFFCSYYTIYFDLFADIGILEQDLKTKHNKAIDDFQGLLKSLQVFNDYQLLSKSSLMT